MEEIEDATKDFVENYLKKWKDFENGKSDRQENALKYLFKTMPENKDLRQILIKVATLNEFYSTNILDIDAMAKHIQNIANLDAELRAGNSGLVKKIEHAGIKNKKGKEILFYSFATKYCSHHNEEAFPIFDTYVCTLLTYWLLKYKDEEKIKNLLSAWNLSKKNKTTIGNELKNYDHFIEALETVKSYFNVSEYTHKKFDQSLWLYGKKFFQNKKPKTEKQKTVQHAHPTVV